MTSSTPDALWSSPAVRALRPAAVEVRGVRTRRGDLRGIDLSVPVGARLLLVSQPEDVATTLVRILAGVARPAGGTLSIAGLRWREAADGWGRRVGYVGPATGVYPWLSPREALSLAARLAGLERGDAEERVEDALDRMGVGRDATRPIGRGGPPVAQKVALAAALITDPEVLLADEPLRSVDPAERRRLLTLPGRRRTLVLASRYPASEEGLVNQVALIRDGRLAAHAAVDELAARDLPFNARGIEALADMRVGRAPALGAPSAPVATPADLRPR